MYVMISKIYVNTNIQIYVARYAGSILVQQILISVPQNLCAFIGQFAEKLRENTFIQIYFYPGKSKVEIEYP
jgi:hypothetical protein